MNQSETKSFISYLTPPEMAAVIVNDTQDTLDKLSTVINQITDIMSADVGETVEITVDEINALINGTLVLDDGDCMRFVKRENNGSTLLSVLSTGVDGTQEIYTDVCSLESGNNWIVLTDTLDDLSGKYTWSQGEILESVFNTYNTNDLLQRAAKLIQQGEYSPSAFNAACSDIMPNLSGAALDMYSMILNNVDAQNPFSFLQVANQIYSNGNDMNDVDNTIEFNTNNYYVKGFLGTFSSVITSVVSTVISVIGYAISPIVGIIATLASTVWNAFNSAVDQVAEAKLNYKSLNRMYAQPLYQSIYPMSWFSASNKEQLYKLFQQTRLLQFIMPGISGFIWYNDAELTDQSNVYLEVYVNCYAQPFYGENSDINPAYSNLISVSFSNSNRSAGTFSVNYNMISNTSKWSEVLPARSVSAGSYSDAELKEMVTAGVMTWELFLISSYARHVVGASSFSMNFSGLTGISNLQDITGIALRFLRRIQQPGGWNWDNLVNTVIPTDDASIFDIAGGQYMIDDLLKIFLYKNSSGGGQYAVTITNTYERGDWYITPPSYTRSAVIWTTIALAATAVAAVAFTAYTKMKVKKRINKTMLNRKSKVDAALNAYKENPTSENYDIYYKEVRKHNVLAKIFNTSTLSVTNPNQVISEQSEDFSIFNNRGVQEVIDLIKR